jgi:hypothetical protein
MIGEKVQASNSHHSSFEKAFCNKLANSGVANFANVHGCMICYVANNAKGKAPISQGFYTSQVLETTRKSHDHL